MARHTVLCSAGRRLDVQPCKTSPGLVQVQILGADRQVMASCTMDANAAAVLSQALDIEAHAAAEVVNAAARVVDRFEAERLSSESNGAGVAVDIGCTCAASTQARFKPPCTCGEGRLSYFRSGKVVASALPAQVARVTGWGAGLETAFNRATAGA